MVFLIRLTPTPANQRHRESVRRRSAWPVTRNSVARHRCAQPTACRGTDATRIAFHASRGAAVVSGLTKCDPTAPCGPRRRARPPSLARNRRLALTCAKTCRWRCCRHEADHQQRSDFPIVIPTACVRPSGDLGNAKRDFGPPPPMNDSNCTHDRSHRSKLRRCQ